VKGAVKSYDTRRGAGLISPDGGGKDVFVYVSELERAGLVTLVEGERLSFDVRTDIALRRSFAVNLGAV
jgi:cold shock protein